MSKLLTIVEARKATGLDGGALCAMVMAGDLKNHGGDGTLLFDPEELENLELHIIDFFSRFPKALKEAERDLLYGDVDDRE